MATIIIETTAEEQQDVIYAINSINRRAQAGVAVPMSLIATEADMTANRVRYVISDLLDAGRISRTPIRAFNKHYVRYSYTVVDMEEKNEQK